MRFLPLCLQSREKVPDMNDLAAAAQAWGIESGYFDVFGKYYAARPETLERLLTAVSGGHERPPELPAQPEPIEAFQGDDRKLWALAAQLYALRSRRNWGHGDFTDLGNLIACAAQSGAAGVGLNPLHALFTDRAEQASPYAPNSRVYLNPLYIDVDAVPEFPGLEEAGLAAEVAALRGTDFVDYTRVAAAKLRGLTLAHANFRTNATAERRADFEAYRHEQGEALLRFACFEVLRCKYPAPWTEWPQPWRSPDRVQLRRFRRANQEGCEFHEFMQWIADRQLAACAKAARHHGMPVGLYIDLAVGIDRHGADAWSQQDAVLADVSMGAPPDELNRGGQDWGLAPFNPHALPNDDFKSVRLMMRAAMRHAGAVRLDHVLGLQRVFMIPLGRGAVDGTYVRFPFHHLLRVVAEESRRLKCVVVGEDLGTVPEHFRETLTRWGLWCYRVMLFEREGDGRFTPPEAYPAGAVATFSTHDLPTFRGWLEMYDLAVKRGIGVDPGENDDARAWAHKKLHEILSERVPAWRNYEIAAVAAFLAQTPSRLVVMSIEDMLGERDQVNIPGTTDQHPNWRRKLPVLLEELGEQEDFRRVVEAFEQGGRRYRSE